MLKHLTYLALSAITLTAQVNFTEEFTVTDSDAFSIVNWSALAENDTGLADYSSSTSGGVIAVSNDTNSSSGDYGFFAPKIGPDFDNTTSSALIFTGKVDDVAIGNLTSLGFDHTIDGAPGDPGNARLAIRIGSDWYASDSQLTGGTTNLGPPFTSGAIDTPFTLSGIDFADGSNWRVLTVTEGGGGSLSVAGSAVGGTLTGLVTDFGLLIEDAGGDGDHFRFDNYNVQAVPEPAAFALLAGALALAGTVLRRRSK